MSTQAKAPIGSRWMLKDETKGRAFVVTERKPFGKIELKQEDRAYFGSSTQKELLANYNRLPADDGRQIVCLHDPRGPRWIGSYINSRDEVVGLYSAN